MHKKVYFKSKIYLSQKDTKKCHHGINILEMLYFTPRCHSLVSGSGEALFCRKTLKIFIHNQYDIYKITLVYLHYLKINELKSPDIFNIWLY